MPTTKIGRSSKWCLLFCNQFLARVTKSRLFFAMGVFATLRSETVAQSVEAAYNSELQLQRQPILRAGLQ